MYIFCYQDQSSDINTVDFDLVHVILDHTKWVGGNNGVSKPHQRQGTDYGAQNKTSG